MFFYSPSHACHWALLFQLSYQFFFLLRSSFDQIVSSLSLSTFFLFPNSLLCFSPSLLISRLQIIQWPCSKRRVVGSECRYPNPLLVGIKDFRISSRRDELQALNVDIGTLSVFPSGIEDLRFGCKVAYGFSNSYLEMVSCNVISSCSMN